MISCHIVVNRAERTQTKRKMSHDPSYSAPELPNYEITRLVSDQSNANLCLCKRDGGTQEAADVANRLLLFTPLGFAKPGE